MTVATTTTRANYTGDGAITQFSFGFKTLDDAHMFPYLDGVVQGSGFTVTRNADQDASPGGVVDFAVAPAVDELVTLERIVPNTQETDYTEYDPFPAETHETALDLGVMRAQQNADAIDRTVVAPVTDDGSVDYTLPTADAGKAIKWNDAGDALENSTDNIDGITTAAAASAAAALASENAAAGSASSASTSATNAGTSETNAAASEAKAQDWAEEVEDTPVEVGQFSALHHAAKSAASASTSADIAAAVAGTDTYTATLGISAYTANKTYYLSFANTNTIAAPTLNLDGLGAKTIKNLDGSALAIGAIPDEALVRYDGTDAILLNPAVVSGRVAQVVNTQISSVSTGITTMPVDDTIPQNVEGDEYMTLSITPKKTTDKLRIDVTIMASHSTAQWVSTALFQDSTIDAIAAMSEYQSSSDTTVMITFTHYMPAGTTSPTTFKVRIGANSAGTMTFNGNAGSRLFGGVAASSITITEIAQ